MLLEVQLDVCYESDNTILMEDSTVCTRRTSTAGICRILSCERESLLFTRNFSESLLALRIIVELEKEDMPDQVLPIQNINIEYFPRIDHHRY